MEVICLLSVLANLNVEEHLPLMTFARVAQPTVVIGETKKYPHAGSQEYLPMHKKQTELNISRASLEPSQQDPNSFLMTARYDLANGAPGRALGRARAETKANSALRSAKGAGDAAGADKMALSPSP
ncbi:hypothetical protein EVAR_71172_1 [Eumeta japonica]|uniref:Uncharacterized protein n=1 Tax=Eumeta variegata TaxID=151549 RepID=A0A4C1ZP51_EUMVA|nr:hypothetical protein EVAR_71172_1 [Eumeta japonica]